MNANLGPVQCPYCKLSQTLDELRDHRCIANQHQRTPRQDWWGARDGALRAAGLPEAVYGYDVEYLRHDGKVESFHLTGTEAQARRKARLKTLFKSVISVHPYTYAQYCRAFGIPGSKM